MDFNQTWVIGAAWEPTWGQKSPNKVKRSYAVVLYDGLKMLCIFLNHSRTAAPNLTKLAPLIALDPSMVMRGQGHPRSEVISRSPPYLKKPSSDLDQSCTRRSPWPPEYYKGVMVKVIQGQRSFWDQILKFEQGFNQGHPRSFQGGVMVKVMQGQRSFLGPNFKFDQEFS